MTKVLIICPFVSPNIGGVESHLDKLMDFLAKKKIYVYLVAYQPLVAEAKGKKFEKNEYGEIHRAQWFGRGWFNKLENCFPLVFLYLFPGLFISSFFFYIKRRDEIDCIHAHGFASAAIVKILAFIFPKRTVISTHAVYNLEKRPVLARIIYWVLSSFDVILAVSDVSRSELIKIGLDPHKIKVHPNWIDLDRFCPQDKEKCKKELGLGKKVILFVGRMIEKKGISFLLKAAEIFKDISFVFVGSGPMEKQIEGVGKTKKNVFFLGTLRQENPKELEKLRCLYAAADLFACIPKYNEGFGAVYLEAIACGTPVLSSNLGSLPTFLDKSVSVLIEPTQKNVDKSIESLFSTGNKLKMLQSNCRKYAKKHFGEKNAEVILNSYYE